MRGPLDWSGGTLGGEGSFTIANGATFTLSGTSDSKNLGNGSDPGRTTLVNNGTINHSGNKLDLTGGGTGDVGTLLVNNGTYNAINGADIDSAFPLTIFPSFDNQGFFNKSGTATTVIDVPFNNSGTVNINEGTLLLSRATTTTGPFNVAAGATLEIDTAFTVHPGGSIDGPGDVNVGANDSLVLNADLSLENFELSVGGVGGTVLGASMLTIPSGGTFDWFEGTLEGTTTTTIASGATLTLSGSGAGIVKTLGNGSDPGGTTLVNNGTVNHSGGALEITGGGTGDVGTLLVNNGTYNAIGGASLLLENPNTVLPSFTNNGVFNKSGAATTTGITIPFNNSGTVNINGGKLTHSRQFTQTAGTTRVLAGAEWESTLAIDIQGGRVEGEGLIDANVDLAGTLAPGLSAGQLFFEGNLNFTNTAIYEWELDGGGFSDSVDVTGNLLFGSTATLALVDLGGTPNPLTEYTLFTYSGVDPTNPTWSFDTSGAPGWDVSSLVVSVDTVGDRVFLVGLDVGIGFTADFDNDGDVDGMDLDQWEGDYGLNGDSDADGDGDSDGADFLAWQQQFGSGVLPLADSQAVPEPSTFILLLTGMLALHLLRLQLVTHFNGSGE